MAEKKAKTVFYCNECGHESLKWHGRCPGCGAWNSLTEEMAEKKHNKGFLSGMKPLPLSEVEITEEYRFSTGRDELDRVLGGGLVPGSLVLVGGDPGIGKSTLLLQSASVIGREQGVVLYVSGEESAKQIRVRADRLEATDKNLLIYPETNLDSIEHQIKKVNPCLIIIDSIQTIYKEDLASAPGSVSQVRECTGTLLRIAKTSNIPIFIVGHVTKEGAIAGPRVLEHMVDTVLYFEGERHNTFRILRAVKNRFGSTNEMGIFEMLTSGLAEVKNPSEIFIANRPEKTAGSVVIASLEGSRPMLVEIQALITPSNFGMPRRMTTGIDYNRVALLMAVLEKKFGLRWSNHDAYVNVIGGIKIDEPAADLGVALALTSSFKDIPVPQDLLVVGEIGLTGEIRPVNQIEKRVQEGAKLGFKKFIIPKQNIAKLNFDNNVRIFGVKSVDDAMEIALGG